MASRICQPAGAPATDQAAGVTAIAWPPQPCRLLRRVEGKGGNAHQEILAARRFHLVIADHEAGRRRERAAAGVFKALAGREDRLFADDARAADFLQTPETVGDPPMAVAQLHGFTAAILDPHVISP